MHFQSLTSLLLSAGLISLGLARQVAFNDGYDDITVVPEEGRLNPVGDYHGKTYQNIFAQQPGVAGVITLNGVAPHTNPNQALAGTSTTQNSTITTTQGTKSFALQSFYYGCAVKGQQAVADTATACNITVTGYSSTSSTAKPVVSQVFAFTPNTLIQTMAAPAYGTFGSKFSNLAKVVLVQTSKTFGTAGTVMLLDNIVGTYETTS